MKKENLSRDNIDKEREQSDKFKNIKKQSLYLSNKDNTKILMQKQVLKNKEYNDLVGISNLDKEEDIKSIRILHENMIKHEKQDIWMGKRSEKNVKFNLKKLIELSSLLKIKYYRNSLMGDIEKKLYMEFKDRKKAKLISVLYKMIFELPSYKNDEAVMKKYMQVERLLSGTGCKLKDFFSFNFDLEKQQKFLFKKLKKRIL
ncbi:MAG: hypothetical protein N4A54_12965 [Peptostreptococcaceae bacterium]|nr:hypothetical protein [Peptostreptococcaceae bacterium]